MFANASTVHWCLHCGMHQVLATPCTCLAKTLSHAYFHCATTANFITTRHCITLLAGEHSMLSLGSQLSSAQVPADSTTAASMKPAGHTNPAEKKPQHRALAAEDTPQHDATAAEETPITPLQSQPSLPQHSLYTPSDSESRSHQHPSPTTAAASKLTGLAADRSDASQNGARPSILEAQFMKSSRGSGSELGSDLIQQQPQLRPAVAKPESDSEAFSDPLDPQLSPPQSRPSSPECHTAEGTDKGSNDLAVTHVNGYFDKSDEDNSSSSRPELSDQGSEKEGEEEAGRSASRSRNRSRPGAVGNLAQSLEVILFYGISMTRTSMQLYFLYPDLYLQWVYHTIRPVFVLCLLSVCLFAIHTYPADCKTLVTALGQQGCSISVAHGVIGANHAPQHSTCSKLCP